MASWPTTSGYSKSEEDDNRHADFGKPPQNDLRGILHYPMTYIFEFQNSLPHDRAKRTVWRDRSGNPS